MSINRFSHKSFKRQPHKMVKHTQTIRRLLPSNCLSVFDYFLGLALKGLILPLDDPFAYKFLHIGWQSLRALFFDDVELDGRSKSIISSVI